MTHLITFNASYLQPKKAMSGYSRLMQIMKGQVPSITTFGIMSVDNPQNMALSEPENKKRREQFKEVLKRAHYGYVQHNGMYDRFEKAFFIMNVRLDNLEQWCSDNQFDQESFIFGEVVPNQKVTFTLYYGNTPGPQREVVLHMEDGVENYYSEYKGRKFVIPFFDDDYIPEQSETNVPVGVPFEGPEVENEENATHLATIFANQDALKNDALGKTAGMSNWHKRGQILEAVRKLKVTK